MNYGIHYLSTWKHSLKYVKTPILTTFDHLSGFQNKNSNESKTMIDEIRSIILDITTILWTQ